MNDIIIIPWVGRAERLREAGLYYLADNYYALGVTLFPVPPYTIYKNPKYRNADGNESIDSPDPSRIEPSQMADSLLDMHFGFNGDMAIDRQDFLECIELGRLIARYAHYYGKSRTSHFIKLSHRAYVLGRGRVYLTKGEKESMKALHLKAKEIHAKKWPRRQPTDPPPYEAPPPYEDTQ